MTNVTDNRNTASQLADFIKVEPPRSGRVVAETGEIVNEASHLLRVDDAMTSFDELSVVQFESRIDLKSVYPLSALRDVVTVADGGAVSQGNGVFVVSTSSNADATATFQSVERGRYVAGMDALAGIGLSAPTRPTGNQEIEWGYTDFTNGFVVGEDSTGIYMAVYSGGTRGTKIYQSDWNINTLLTGDFVLDPEEFNIYRFAFRWYGRGPVTLELASEIGTLATKTRANQIKATSGELITKDPNQPLSVRVKNNGTGTAMSVKVAGRNFGIRGLNRPELRENGATRTGVSVSSSAFVPLVSARHKTGSYLSISTVLAGISIMTTEDLIFQVIAKNTLTDATFANPGFSDSGVESAMEYDISATALADGVAITRPFLASGAAGNRSTVATRDLPTAELPGNSQIVTLAAKAIGTTASVSAVLSVREEW